MKKRIKQFSDDICRLSHDAELDGLDAQNLVDVLLASVHGIVFATGGNERDVAELYWELSKFHDARADRTFIPLQKGAHVESTAHQ